MTPSSDPLTRWLTAPLAATPLFLPDRVDIVAIYARFSHGGDEHESARTQVRRGKEAAKARHPDAETRVYVDDGYKGDTMERPGFQRMLTDIRSGIITIVSAKNQTRIERAPEIWDAFCDTCLPVGIDTLETWGMRSAGVSLGDVSGRVNSVVGNDYLRQNRLNVLDHLAMYAGDGRPAGGGCSGYTCGRMKNDDGDMVPTLLIDERMAPLLRIAAEQVLAGTPMTDVTAAFNEAGAPTRRGGEEWRPSNLRRLLRSPTIAGLRVHITEAKRKELRAAGVHYFTLAVAHAHGAVYRGNWEPILDGETFLAVQRVLDEPGFVVKSNGQCTPRGVPRGRVSKYLLSGADGIGVCGRCGHSLTGTKRKDRPAQYVCHSSAGGCDGIGVHQDPVDKAVGEEFLAVLESEGFRASLAAGDPYAAQRDAFIMDIAALDRNRVADAEDLRAQVISRATANARAADADRAEAAVRAQLAALPPPVEQIDPDELAAAFRYSDVTAQRRMLKLVLDRVVIHPGRNGVFDPDRVKVYPRELP